MSQIIECQAISIFKDPDDNRRDRGNMSHVVNRLVRHCENLGAMETGICEFERLCTLFLYMKRLSWSRTSQEFIPLANHLCEVLHSKRMSMSRCA